MHQNAPSGFDSREGTSLGCMLGPQLGAHRRQQICVSLSRQRVSLSLSPFLSL